jgi:hypothetical protein
MEKTPESVKTFDMSDLKQAMSSEVLPKEIHSEASSSTAAVDPDGDLEVKQESPKEEERKYLTGS